MSKYTVPDGHWDRDEDRPDPESPARIEAHDVEVIFTFDPTEGRGYGRTKYTIHIGHDFEDSPVAVFATEHRWKGNFWRDVRQIDWHDLPGSVQQQVATVVACGGVGDLHPGERVIGEGGESTWKVRHERESESESESESEHANEHENERAHADETADAADPAAEGAEGADDGA